MAYAAEYGAMSPPYGYPPASYAPQAAPPAGVAMQPSPQGLPPPAKPGTLPVGTRIMIGQYKVTIERFLSEGGFAHVYVVRSSAPISVGGAAQTQHVLKRLAVPDKTQLQEVRKEVENMKRVSGHAHIVNFIEASASQLPGKSGYEIFILMEYVPGGGIIDMMNTRLQHRLTESEILKIFSDTTEAVVHMHHLDPPMMHRDLKVENILMASQSNYKLCDFGSATVPLPSAPKTMPEIQALENDLNRTTTLQYRSPEMLDVWARKHVGLPADIWALGVFLYKLCYYTTPFEPHGVLAIQNVTYSFPPYPAYSSAIKDLIASMLQGDASKRPNADAVYMRVCQLRGVTPKFHSRETVPSLPRRPKVNPMLSPPASDKPPDILAPSKSPPSASRNPPPPAGPSLADAVAPMRRGRPKPAATPSASSISSLKPPSSSFGDAFTPPSPEPAAKSASQPQSATNDKSKSSSEFTEFESQFPALDDNFSISGASINSPSVTGSSINSKDGPTPEITRHASGFQDLLTSPSKGPSPQPSRPASRFDLQDLTSTESTPPAPSPTTAIASEPSGGRTAPVKPPKPQFVDSAIQTGHELMEQWYHERRKVDLKQSSSQSESTQVPRRLVSVGEEPRLNRSDPSPGPPTKVDLLADSPSPIDTRQNVASTPDSSDGEVEPPEDLDAATRRPAYASPPQIGINTATIPKQPTSSSQQSTSPVSVRRTPSASLRSRPESASAAPVLPHMAAPVAKKAPAAISNLVSRYETLSTQPDEQEETRSSSSASRRRPQSLYGTASSRGPSPQTQSWKSPPPPVAEKPTPGPLKPTKPLSASRPVPGPKPSLSSSQEEPPMTAKPPVATPAPESAPTAEQDEDEPFVGVAKMKERWQTGANVKRSSSTYRSNRQEWKAV